MSWKINLCILFHGSVLAGFMQPTHSRLPYFIKRLWNTLNIFTFPLLEVVTAASRVWYGCRLEGGWPRALQMGGRCLWVRLSVNACCPHSRKSWEHLHWEIPFLLPWSQLSRPPPRAPLAHKLDVVSEQLWHRGCGWWFPCGLGEKGRRWSWAWWNPIPSEKALWIWIILFKRCPDSMIMLPLGTTYLAWSGLTVAVQNGCA